MKIFIRFNLILISLTMLSNLSYSQNFTRKSIKTFENTQIAAWGMAAIDYDSDGLLDLFCIDVQNEERLFHNEGNGTYKLINNEEGGINGGTRDCGISWGDFDNDGDPDPIIGTQIGINHVFKNDGNKGFTRMTEDIIATDPLNSYNAVWVDYDNDGWLDLFTGNVLTFDTEPRPGAPNFLFHNNGNGTFTKIENDVISNDIGNNCTGSFADYDNDGDQDLFVPDMGSENYFYTNNSNGTFTKVTDGDIIKDTAVSISGSWADYDNDGNLDIFIANGGIIKQKDMLYQNNGDGTFTRIHKNPIVENSAMAWNGAWGDYDNDGDEDLYVSVWRGTNYFYINNGNGTFTQDYDEPIVSDSDSSITSVSVWGDFDNDGDLDFITANCTSSRNIYYENSGNSNHWIRLKLIGTVSNRSAVGAQVRIKTTINGKPVNQMREISASNGFRSISNDFWAHFGLGDATKIDLIEIRWPSGQITTQMNISADQILTITEKEEKTI